MTIDLSPVLGAAATLCAAAITGCAPLVAAALGRRLRVQNNAAWLAEVDQAAKVAAGLAYHVLAAAAAKPCNVEVRNAAVAAGVRYVVGAAPAALAALNLPHERVGALVAGELGRLLAIDPTVTAGPSAAAPG